MQVCRTCKEEKSLKDFYRRSDTKRFFTECKVCSKKRTNKNRKAQRGSDPDSYYQRERKQRRTHYELNRNKYWDSVLKQRYGISLEDYHRMYDDQQGNCAICRDWFPKERSRSNAGHLVVDHCHSSGKVRGLLCKPCNTGIGALKESEDIFMSAISYLKQA